MKKKTICSLLSLLLLLTLVPIPAAVADSYITLGSYPAGEELNCFVAQVDAAATITAEDLPEGCRLEESVNTGAKLLNLTGVPLRAGDLQFSISAGDTIYCTINITPAVPQITVTGDQRCAPGARVELRAEAHAADGGSLSYQWYSGMGIMAVPIPGATGSFLVPDTMLPGTFAYCCEVTNTNQGMSVSAMSDIVSVTVAEPVASAVSIETMPSKTSYFVGDRLETAGLRLLVSYDDGSRKIVSDGFSAEPEVFTQAGTHSVKISYQGRSCGFNVRVERAEETVEGIGVLSLPNKTVYTRGENLETAGLSIRAYTADGGHYDVSSGLDCSPTVLRETGSQTITVRYAEKTCTFTVKVEDDEVVTGISVRSLPNTREYRVGDRIDTSGLAIQVNSNRGSETLTTGFTVTPKVVTSPGTQEITVLYGKFSTKFSVTVKEKESPSPTPRPSPSPSATAAPTASPGETPAAASASPAAAPVHTPPVRRNSGVGTAVKLVFAVAVLALAGLIGYVWYLRRRGFEEEPARTAAPAPRQKPASGTVTDQTTVIRRPDAAEGADGAGQDKE